MTESEVRCYGGEQMGYDSHSRICGAHGVRAPA